MTIAAACDHCLGRRCTVALLCFLVALVYLSSAGSAESVRSQSREPKSQQAHPVMPSDDDEWVLVEDVHDITAQSNKREEKPEKTPTKKPSKRKRTKGATKGEQPNADAGAPHTVAATSLEEKIRLHINGVSVAAHEVTAALRPLEFSEADLFPWDVQGTLSPQDVVARSASMTGGIPFLTQERGHTLVKMLQDLTRDHYRMLYAFRNVSSGNASFQQQRKRMEETTAILEEAQQVVLQQHALHRKFLYSATSVIPVIAQTLSLQKRSILAAVGLADDDKHSSEDGIAMEGYSERKEARKLARQVGTAITACNELMVAMQRSLRRLELATLKDLKSVIIASVAVRLSKWHLCGLTPAEWAKLVVFANLPLLLSSAVAWVLRPLWYRRPPAARNARGQRLGSSSTTHVASVWPKHLLGWRGNFLLGSILGIMFIFAMEWICDAVTGMRWYVALCQALSLSPYRYFSTSDFHFLMQEFLSTRQSLCIVGVLLVDVFWLSRVLPPIFGKSISQQQLPAHAVLTPDPH